MPLSQSGLASFPDLFLGTTLIVTPLHLSLDYNGQVCYIDCTVVTVCLFVFCLSHDRNVCFQFTYLTSQYTDTLLEVYIEATVGEHLVAGVYLDLFTSQMHPKPATAHILLTQQNVY